MNEPQWLTTVRSAEQLFDQNQFDEARKLADQALKMKPDCGLALQVIGLVHARRDEFDEAIPILNQALSIRPDLVPAHNDLGMIYACLGEMDRAIRYYDQALLLQPDHMFARFNRAWAWLKQGRYREGWIDYEWRWQSANQSRPEIPRPRWDGAPLDGRTMLVHTEQGFGDTVQYVRFLPLLKKQGGRIVLACQKPLHALLQSIDGVDEWMPIDVPSDIPFDIFTPLLSLTALLELNEEADFSCDSPYIFAEPDRVEKWSSRIKQLPGLKIGIGWQGSPTFKRDAFRSIPLEEFAPLAKLPDVSLVSLQKGDGIDQIESRTDPFPLTVFDDHDSDGAFLDTAAIMQHLDLVITSDTALAHVAGALGVPVWLAVSTSSDWRWLIDREDSPWYPTMRIFRQTTLGNWTDVFLNIAKDLKSK